MSKSSDSKQRERDFIYLAVKEAIIDDTWDDGSDDTNSVTMNPFAMEKLDLREKDYILIRGHEWKNTVCIVLADKALDNGMIRMNKVLRSNLGVGLDDFVAVRHVKCGKLVHILPPRDLTGNWVDDYLKPYFSIGRPPVKKGNLIRITGCDKTVMKFEVIETDPSEYCIVTLDTKISCEEPVGREESGMTQSDGQVDMFLKLPESVIHHILSFVEQPYCSRICFLSKKWDSIWKNIPTLDFYGIRTFGVHTAVSYMPSVMTGKFLKYVEGTICRHAAGHLQSFYLYWPHHLQEDSVKSWISTLLKKNVQNLCLFLKQEHPLSLPPQFFACRSLTSLNLGIVPGISFPVSEASFPVLKELILHFVSFTNASMHQNLFSGCPVLENLSLYKCTWGDEVNLCISIETLKYLKITNRAGGERSPLWWVPTMSNGDDRLHKNTVKIFTPGLKSFYYCAHIAKEYQLSSFLSLEEARVEFCFEDNSSAAVPKSTAVPLFFQAIKHVKRLFINHDTVKAICGAESLDNIFSTFHIEELTMLLGELESHGDGDEHFVKCLNAIPSLESLILDTSDDRYYEEDVDEGEDGTQQECDDSEEEDVEVADDDGDDMGAINAFRDLISVRFHGFSGNSRDLRLVKVILKKAVALQDLEIIVPETVSKRFQKVVSKKIRGFPKVSSDVSGGRVTIERE